MNLNSKILVTGHRGLVGSAVVRYLESNRFHNVLTVDEEGNRNAYNGPLGSRFDFRNAASTQWLFSCHEPEYVFHCAAKVGGIKGNAENQSMFLLDNLAIQTNVITSAAAQGVKKLVFLGSSCIYPKNAPLPIKEESLLSGPLEPTNEGYALAKITGVKLCQYLHQKGHCFVSAMPCNLFGINDKFDPHAGHIIPGMMARMHAAKLAGDLSFKVWGSPEARREVMFSDDVARALVLVMDEYFEREPINVGSSMELSVLQIAEAVASAVGYTGALVMDSREPAGTIRKVMDNGKLTALGFVHRHQDFAANLQSTYGHFLAR